MSRGVLFGGAFGEVPLTLASKIKGSGKGRSVVQSIIDDDHQTEEIQFVRAVMEGLRDLENGKIYSAAETKAKFGIERPKADR
jgi:hypothetical protein